MRTIHLHIKQGIENSNFYMRTKRERMRKTRDDFRCKTKEYAIKHQTRDVSLRQAADDSLR